MRKLFFISLAIITLSLNAVAQNQRLTDVKIIKALNSFKNLHIKSNEGKFKAQAKNPEINSIHKIQRKTLIEGSFNQLVDSVFRFKWDTQNNNWSNIIDNKTIITYDAKNREISSFSKQLYNNKFVDYFRTVTVYDDNDNYTITDQISRNSIWENSYRTLTTNSISGDNMVMEEVNQDWDGAQWVNINKVKYIGDFKDKNFPTFISITIQEWSGDTWVNSSQFIDISYLAGFQSDLLNFWTFTIQNWVNNAWFTVHSRTYDAVNKIAVETETQTIGLGGVDYEHVIKQTTTYDANINPINKIVEFWRATDWVKSSKEIYTHDANNNNTGTLVQNWKSDWVDSLKYTKKFDANNNMTSYLEEELDQNIWVNSQLKNIYYDENSFEISNTIKYWNYNGSEIAFGDSTVNYYRTVPTSVKSLKMADAKISIYPNPTFGKAVLNLNTIAGEVAVTIRSAIGGQISTQSYQDVAKVDLNFPKASGLYLVELKDAKGRVQTLKVVKR